LGQSPNNDNTGTYNITFNILLDWLCSCYVFYSFEKLKEIQSETQYVKQKSHVNKKIKIAKNK